MESRGAKRKRSVDLKNTLVTQLYDLNNLSFKLTEDLNTANEDFVLLFKSIGERQSEIYANAIGIDEQYEYMLGLLKGNISAETGESSKTPTTLPPSYNADTPKFFDDSCVSLDGHAKAFAQKIDDMIKEVDDQATIWKGKLTEMKKQADHLVSQRTKLAGQLSEFAKGN